jgi:predicted Zn-ribbon and HTH transcriptional regulator
MDKEQTILRKNTLLALEGGSEKIDKISNNIDKRVDFLLCTSCFWCASYFNSGEVSTIRCPMCHNNRIDQRPVSIDRVWPGHTD